MMTKPLLAHRMREMAAAKPKKSALETILERIEQAARSGEFSFLICDYDYLLDPSIDSQLQDLGFTTQYGRGTMFIGNWLMVRW